MPQKAQPKPRRKSLPLKRQKFVDALLENNGNQTKAAEAAGYAKPTSQGSRLLRFVDVQAAVQERMAKGAARAEEIQARLALMACGAIPTKTVIETGTAVDKEGNATPVQKKRHEFAMESATNTQAKIAGLLKDAAPPPPPTSVNLNVVLAQMTEDGVEALARALERAKAIDVESKPA